LADSSGARNAWEIWASYKGALGRLDAHRGTAEASRAGPGLAGRRHGSFRLSGGHVATPALPRSDFPGVSRPSRINSAPGRETVPGIRRSPSAVPRQARLSLALWLVPASASYPHTAPCCLAWRRTCCAGIPSGRLIASPCHTPDRFPIEFRST
jgi:hypothetical protein